MSPMGMVNRVSIRLSPGVGRVDDAVELLRMSLSYCVETRTHAAALWATLVCAPGSTAEAPTTLYS